MRLPRIPEPLGDRRYVLAGIALLVAAGALSVTLLIPPGEAATGPQGEPEIPAEYVGAFREAGVSCPAVSPPRLAGQVMAESQFRTDARTSRAGAGLSGLTDDEWTTWQPWDDANRADPAANILALGHLMCDLVGHARQVAIPGDPWQLALAAFRLGFEPVRQAGGVPAGAKDYVSEVADHASWFAHSPGFGGPGWSTQLPTPSTTPSPSHPPATASTTPSPGSTTPTTTRPATTPPSTQSSPPATTNPPPPVTHLLLSPHSNSCLAGTGGAGTAVVIQKCDRNNPRMMWEFRDDNTVRANGLCLATAGDPAEYIALLQLAPCDSSAGQRYSRDSSTAEIRNLATGKCVDIRHEEKADGSEVMVWACNGQTNQRWNLA